MCLQYIVDVHKLARRYIFKYMYIWVERATRRRQCNSHARFCFRFSNKYVFFYCFLLRLRTHTYTRCMHQQQHLFVPNYIYHFLKRAGRIVRALSAARSRAPACKCAEHTHIMMEIIFGRAKKFDENWNFIYVYEDVGKKYGFLYFFVHSSLLLAKCAQKADVWYNVGFFMKTFKSYFFFVNVHHICWRAYNGCLYSTTPAIYFFICPDQFRT